MNTSAKNYKLGVLCACILTVILVVSAMLPVAQFCLKQLPELGAVRVELATAEETMETAVDVHRPVPQAEVHNIFSLFDTGPDAKLGDDKPYDIDTIKNMTLEDLNWTECDIDGDGKARWTYNITDPDTGKNETLTVIEGMFGGDKMLGGDTYTMIPRDFLMANKMQLRTIHAKHGAVLVLPDGYPNVPGRGYGFFANAHDIPEPSKRTTEMILAALLVSRFDTPVMFVGEHEDNWKLFQYKNQDGILYPSILAILLRNEYSADAMKMTYMYLLVRTNLLGHTLFERLLEKEGNIPKGQALAKGLFSEGGSKQGYARWLVGILDDRVTVLEADACQVQDLSKSTEFFYKDWGVPPIRNSSAGDWANFSNQVATILISLGEGMKAGSSIPTSPGVLAHDVWDIYPQRHMLKPKFISITGDVGGGFYKDVRRTKYKLQHDGTYFVLGCESRFLRDLPKEKEWRYGRVQTKHALGYTGDVPYNEDRQICNILSAVEHTLLMDHSRWPKVDGVSYTLEPKNATTNYFNVTANIKYPNPNTTVTLWYAANSDRRWNDPEHTAEPFMWTRARMKAIDTTYTTYTVSVNVSSKWMYGYYVESELPGAVYPIIGQSKMFDASPVEFIQEYPVEATGASDLYIGSVIPSTTTPMPGEIVNLDITMNATRLAIWYEDENVTTGEKVGHYPTPPLVNIESALYVDDIYEKSTTSTIFYGTKLQLNWTAVPGRHTLTVVVDYNNLLPERNEFNNTWKIVIEVPEPEIPELDIWVTVVLAAALLCFIGKRKKLKKQKTS